MFRSLLAVGLGAILCAPAVAQDITRLAPENAATSPHWQAAADGPRHIASGVVCPRTLPSANLPLTEVQIYRLDGRDVACQYRLGRQALVTVFITDYVGQPFDAVSQSANASVLKAKGLTRLEPGSGQCDGILDQVIGREPRATHDAAPAYCALYGSGGVHSALMLAPARGWILKIRHSRAGAPDGENMVALVTGTIDALRDMRRGAFAEVQ